MTVDDKNFSNIAQNGDVTDFKSTGGAFAAANDDDVVEREILKSSNISNVEILEKYLDYTDYVEYSASKLSADRKPPEENPDGLHDVRIALSRMTASDLEQFLNVYDFLTNPDPKIDQVIDEIGVEQLLSGELLDGERFKSDRVFTHVVDGNGPKSDPVDEYYVTFFDVYDHIERWKKRLRPMMNKIEDLAHASRVVQRQSSVPSVPGGVSRPRDPGAFAAIVPSADVRPPSRRKIIENFDDDDDDDDEDINAISSRYLSNIDEYVKAAESSFEFRPKVSGDRPTATDAENHRVASVNDAESSFENRPKVSGDRPTATDAENHRVASVNDAETGFEFHPKVSGDRPTAADSDSRVAPVNAPVQPVSVCDLRRPADSRTDSVTPKNTMTLLRPSSAYLETGYREASADELEVKTYILT